MASPRKLRALPLSSLRHWSWKLVCSLSDLALQMAPKFSTFSNYSLLVIELVPLKAIFWVKYDAPVVPRVSCLDPLPTYTPTFEVAPRTFSVQTRIPFESVVDWNGLTNLSGSGISPNGRSPKVSWIGAFENCKNCSFCWSSPELPVVLISLVEKARRPYLTSIWWTLFFFYKYYCNVVKSLEDH